MMPPPAVLVAARGRGTVHPQAGAASSNRTVGHGWGDITSVAFLRGHAEPTFAILHGNPNRCGGSVWAGRMGRHPEEDGDACEGTVREDRDGTKIGEDSAEGSGTVLRDRYLVPTNRHGRQSRWVWWGMGMAGVVVIVRWSCGRCET